MSCAVLRGPAQDSSEPGRGPDGRIPVPRRMCAGRKPQGSWGVLHTNCFPSDCRELYDPTVSFAAYGKSAAATGLEGRRMLRRGCVAALVAALLGIALPAAAAPVLYQYTSGSATITVTAGASTLAIKTLPLNGVFAKFDDSAPQRADFNFPK